MTIRWTVATTKEEPVQEQPILWGAQIRPPRARRTTARRRRGEPGGEIHAGSRRFW